MTSIAVDLLTARHKVFTHPLKPRGPKNSSIVGKRINFWAKEVLTARNTGLEARDQLFNRLFIYPGACFFPDSAHADNHIYGIGLVYIRIQPHELVVELDGPYSSASKYALLLDKLGLTSVDQLTNCGIVRIVQADCLRYAFMPSRINAGKLPIQAFRKGAITERSEGAHEQEIVERVLGRIGHPLFRNAPITRWGRALKLMF